MIKFLIKRAVNIGARGVMVRINERLKIRKVVSIETEGTCQGRVLLSYLVSPFLLKDGEPVPNTHTNYWENLQIAETFLKLGYSVDVIDYRNKSFRPSRDYDFFIDIRWNMQRLAGLINPDCIKISHQDIAHFLFHNTAEMMRLLQLQERKFVTLVPRRFERPNMGIELADFATVIGNDFTLDTYRFSGKPLFKLPVSTPILYERPDEKNFDAARNRFLWMGSSGMVHKGLDLVLDAFTEMPQCELFICGPVEDEKEFVNAFYRELYLTPNIHLVGWVDIDSDKFRALCENCVGLVYPSCSEGQSGAVLTGMHAGLIPILSRETGVDITDNFGIQLSECDVAEIVKVVTRISQLPADDLRQMSLKTWEYSRANNTRGKFAQVYREVIEEIIETSARAGQL